MGRTLRDTLPLTPPIPRNTTVFDDCSNVSRVWKDVWLAKEHALKSRLAKQTERLEIGSRELKPLNVGDTVRVQNQTGSHPNKWDKTGIVVQVGVYNQYLVRIDGYRRLTLRNRQYLRKMIPPKMMMQEIPNRNLEHTAQFPPEPSIVAHQPVQQSEPEAVESTVQPPAEPLSVAQPPVQQSEPQAQPTTVQPSAEIEIQVPATQLPVSQPVEPKKSRGRPPKSKGCPWLRKNADIQQSEPQAAEPIVQPPTEQPTMDRPPIVHQQDEPGPALRRSTRERRKPDWHGTRE